MNTDRDKRIAEALGLCEHDIRPLGVVGEDGMEYVCTKGCGYEKAYYDARDNRCPIFSTFDGMGLILQKGPEQRDKESGYRWWERFVSKIWYDEYGYYSNINALPTELLQDPNRLANELYTFFKEGS